GPKYRRLPGRSGLFVRNSLWIQPDHVLRLRRNPFSEEYRRYYFADIQAIVLTELPNTGSYYGFAIAAALVLIAGALASALHAVSAILCVSVALPIFLVALRRRNCACYLKTLVSTEELPSLRRLNAARTSIAILQAEIQRAQGEISQETLDAHRSILGAGPAAVNPETPHYGGMVHWILFPLALLRGVLAAVVLAARLYAFPMSMLGSALSGGVLLMALIAAVKQHKTDLARGVRRLVYAVLAWYALSAVATLGVSIYIGIVLGTAGSRPSVDPNVVLEHPAMRYLQLANVGALFLIGCAGLILLWQHQSATRTPPPLAPENEGLGAG
ncbi:MAG TPA: hypothetical protein VGV35_09230, partial [Bryobacteraceae bacterium]|nr:hypothetical protein [Bryobacteraceae bacterium]